MQRVTALALIPLTLWFAASLIACAGSDHGAFILWLRTPLPTVSMVLLLIALFYHMALGLQVVVEDYVHSERIKLPTVVVIHLACFALAAAGIIATLRIASGG
jgi:succinate dehydrogenase / fumarate reductase membrane anchor subunit